MRAEAEKLKGKAKEYCFDLDYNDHDERKNLYTVDSRRYGRCLASAPSPDS